MRQFLHRYVAESQYLYYRCTPILFFLMPGHESFKASYSYVFQASTFFNRIQNAFQAKEMKIFSKIYLNSYNKKKILGLHFAGMSVYWKLRNKNLRYTEQSCLLNWTSKLFAQCTRKHGSKENKNALGFVLECINLQLKALQSTVVIFVIIIVKIKCETYEIAKFDVTPTVMYAVSYPV